MRALVSKHDTKKSHDRFKDSWIPLLSEKKEKKTIKTGSKNL